MNSVMQEPQKSDPPAVSPGPSTFMCLPAEPSREQLRMIELEAHASRLCLAQMQDLATNHALWMAHFDDVDPDTADMPELVMLLESAPNAFAQGLIFGKLTLRSQIAAVTGRGF